MAGINAARRITAPVRPFLSAFRNLQLDSKLALSLIVIGMIGFAFMFAALTAVINPSFSSLESRSVASHVERTRAALDEYSARVETAVRDYGAWDDSFTYLNAPSQQFETGTFSVLAMTNLDVNGMAYVKFDGTVLFSRWVDIENQVEVAGLGREFEALAAQMAKDSRVRNSESMRFYARFGDRVAALSAARVVRTDGSGTPTGFVVMAREINSRQLSALLQIDARIALADRKPAPLLAERPNRLDIAVNVEGQNKERIAQAKFSVDRNLMALGQSTLLLAVVSSAIILVLTLLAMRFLIKRIIIVPMRTIEQHMQHISKSGELRALNGAYSRDEVGSLIQNLNAMLGQLKDLRERLEIQSFKLGRTESAVGVMHNVRNGLNPIKVILSRQLTDSRVSGSEDTAKALDELQQDSVAPERRVRLIQFLKLVFEADVAKEGRRREEIQTARDCLTNVVELIGKQQSAAHEKIDTEPCEIADVLRQNAALAQYSSAGKVRFVVEESDVMGLGNRVLLSQVVGNLFANAVEAIAAVNRETGLIEVTFVATHDVIQVRIRDNGEGFVPEKGKQLFERGYSSRKEKPGGLGLHWCANALTLMNGKLALESDGAGLGATAVITLPAALPWQGEDFAPDPADRAEPDRALDNEADFPAPKIQNLR